MKLSKDKKLARYRNRIEHARKWREGEGYDDTWARMIDLYRGRHFESTAAEDRIAINLAFSTINVIFPSVTVNYPKITVGARNEEDDDRAVITEAVVNYWWKHYDFRTPFRRATKDYLVIGHGWLKLGWRYIEEQAALDSDEYQAAFDEKAAEVDGYAAEIPELAASLPTDDEIAASLPDAKTVVAEDRPFIERIDPRDMFVDPEGTSMDDIGWIAQRIVRPLEDVRSDENYKAGARRSVKADSTIRDDGHYNEASKKRDGDIDRVTVWEFYDLKAGTMCAFAEMNDSYLIDPTPIPYAFGHPFEFMGNYDVPSEFYPIGDLEQIEGLQGELNKTRSQMLNHRKKYGRKYLYRESAFGPEGRQALESDEDNIGVPVIDENTPLDGVVVPVPIQPMSADLYGYSDLIEADVDKVSGVNEYARGTSPEIRRTATEAAILNDAAASRVADKLATIELTIANLGRKVVQLAQQYLTGEQVARVVGLDGSQMWVPFEHDDVKGEFDFEVEGGSTQPHNEQFQRQQALGMLEAVGPFIQMGLVDPRRVIHFVLQKGFGIKSPGKFMMPPTMEEMMGMMPGQAGPEGAQPGGPSGADAPQPPPEEVLEAQNAALSPVAEAQLAGQVGLTL
jgi:hypothetical protein